MSTQKPLSRTLTAALLAGGALAASVSHNVSAHGYSDFPKARQAYCKEDGGYWSSQDGSTIPNAACRAAFLESGTYQFTQAIEFSKNVADYNSQAAVEAGVPNGQLCAAGDSNKSGIDVPHPDWPSQQITLNGAGQFEYRFYASTPHNPSFWKFYLTKPSFNPATDTLNWDDLELVDEKGNVAISTINGEEYYVMDVSLPTDRTGDAVLYTRWQREDVAGEGFYNCSDITLGEAEDPVWSDVGAYVDQGTDPVAGDSIRFRVFDSTGSEVVDNEFAITSANETKAVWTEQLAQQINTNQSMVRVGVQSAGSISYDASDLYANRVYVLDSSYSYQMDLQAGDNSSSSVSSGDNSCDGTPAWDEGSVYTQGDTVVYDGVEYEAQWWTRGRVPADNAGQWQVWQLVGDC